MKLPVRSDICPGIKVNIVEKHNQPTGILTTGIVKRVLTKSENHPHGIKVKSNACQWKSRAGKVTGKSDIIPKSFSI